ncbi:MAG: hypothetical protein FWG11_02490 [Promicromonosporaceae bacterium]|nr:hypothetical protein [Promicromonosporaceae bacterium]
MMFRPQDVTPSSTLEAQTSLPAEPFTIPPVITEEEIALEEQKMVAQFEAASKHVIREALQPDARPHSLEYRVEETFHWATVTGGLIDVIRMDPVPHEPASWLVYELEDSTGYVIHLYMEFWVHTTVGVYDPQTGSRFFPDWDDH